MKRSSVAETGVDDMQHLDEGMIHAWLDGAASADEAARVERHAAECADCAALVAEARGLVAGASRILSALDDVPVVVPGAGSGWRVTSSGTLNRASAPPRYPLPATRHPRWWSRPAALAAAAGVVLMAGSAIVLNKSGGRSSLGAAFSDSAVAPAQTTEAAVPPTGVAADASSGAGRESARGDGAAGAAATSSRAAAPVPTPAPPRQVAAASRAAERRTTGSRPTAASVPASGRAANSGRLESAAVPQQVVTTAVGSAAQKSAATPTSKEALNERPASLPVAPPVAAPAPAADVAVQQRAVAPERAQARRAAAAGARSERVEADAVEQRASSRVDTVFTPGRVDTVQVAAGFRPRGAVASMAPVFPVTGCYQIVEGGLRDTLTLSKTRVWSGTAETRFHASVPGATGYWSQPPNGDIHIMIRGALVNARIDPSTGDLRGDVRRGGRSESFLARRCR